MSTWRSKTTENPWPSAPRRVPHPLAARAGDQVVVFARGTMNSIGVRFEDGLEVCCSRYAVAPPFPPGKPQRFC